MRVLMMRYMLIFQTVDGEMIDGHYRIKKYAMLILYRQKYDGLRFPLTRWRYLFILMLSACAQR